MGAFFLTKLLETIDPAVLRLAAMHTCACDAKSMQRAYYKLGFEISVRVVTLPQRRRDVCNAY